MSDSIVYKKISLGIYRSKEDEKLWKSRIKGVNQSIDYYVETGKLKVAGILCYDYDDMEDFIGRYIGKGLYATFEYGEDISIAGELTEHMKCVMRDLCSSDDRKRLKIENNNDLEYAFPGPIWMRFYKDELELESKNYELSYLVNNTLEVMDRIEKTRMKYKYVVIENCDDLEIYSDIIDKDSILDCLFEEYQDYLFPLAQVDAFVLSPVFRNSIIRYLTAAKVLADEDSDMENIMHQRDICYNEIEDIQRCIDAVNSIKKA